MTCSWIRIKSSAATWHVGEWWRSIRPEASLLPVFNVSDRDVPHRAYGMHRLLSCGTVWARMTAPHVTEVWSYTTVPLRAGTVRHMTPCQRGCVLASCASTTPLWAAVGLGSTHTPIALTLVHVSVFGPYICHHTRHKATIGVHDTAGQVICMATEEEIFVCCCT